jgi:8-oxo-dGTP pyrophosphatase MutT (NUDIX family)
MTRRHGLPPIDEETRRNWRQRRRDHSAGGIAYRQDADGEVVIALIATHRGTRWQLPKGTCEPGESIEQTALREVKEEVGLTGQCETHLGTIEYWYWDTHRKHPAELVHKCVDFYLMRAVGGELSDASIEVDSVNWFAITQADAILTFPSEREMVRKAVCCLVEMGCLPAPDGSSPAP